jgi:hypothetical protein
VKHGALAGGDLILSKWKKKRVKELLKHVAFERLPSGVSSPASILTAILTWVQMSRSAAIKTLAKKFTNYRGACLRKGVVNNEDEDEDVETAQAVNS